jgi:glyoxylate/hydroxypyruvate reductase A
LNADAFAALPRGASLVNAARGAHVVEADLIAALDSGRLAAATLDVFKEEPLPPESPLWRHPKITVTPHIASFADPRSVALQMAENMQRIRRGEAPLHQVDLAKGY